MLFVLTRNADKHDAWHTAEKKESRFYVDASFNEGEKRDRNSS